MDRPPEVDSAGPAYLRGGLEQEGGTLLATGGPPAEAGWTGPPAPHPCPERWRSGWSLSWPLARGVVEHA